MKHVSLYSIRLMIVAALLMTALCRTGQAQTLTLTYHADAASGSGIASNGGGQASIPSASGTLTLTNNITVKNVNFGAISGVGYSTKVGSFLVNFGFPRRIRLGIQGGAFFIVNETFSCSASGRLIYAGGDQESWTWIFTLATFEKTYDLGPYGKLRASFHGGSNGSSGGDGPASYWGNSGPSVDLTYLAPTPH
jgi:hypothetical protein